MLTNANENNDVIYFHLPSGDFGRSGSHWVKQWRYWKTFSSDFQLTLENIFSFFDKSFSFVFLANIIYFKLVQLFSWFGKIIWDFKDFPGKSWKLSPTTSLLKHIHDTNLSFDDVKQKLRRVFLYVHRNDIILCAHIQLNNSIQFNITLLVSFEKFNHSLIFCLLIVFYLT